MKVENNQQRLGWLGVSVLALLTLSPRLAGGGPGDYRLE
jgi:hypothetical protein